MHILRLPLEHIKIVVEATIPNGPKFSYDLLNKRNLRSCGISREGIKEVETVFAVPGYLYEELGVAGLHHPLVGSACSILVTWDGRRLSIDDIWYFDENIERNHFNGRPHWNHERRFVEHTSKGDRLIDRTKQVEGHTIPASPYIDLSLDPGPEGTKVKQRVFSP